MNIFASLKALLLPVTPGALPAGSSSGEAYGDFAALLSTVDQKAAVEPPVAPVGLKTDAVQPDAMALPVADRPSLSPVPVDVAALLTPSAPVQPTDAAPVPVAQEQAIVVPISTPALPATAPVVTDQAIPAPSLRPATSMLEEADAPVAQSDEDLTEASPTAPDQSGTPDPFVAAIPVTPIPIAPVAVAPIPLADAPAPAPMAGIIAPPVQASAIKHAPPPLAIDASATIAAPEMSAAAPPVMTGTPPMPDVEPVATAFAQAPKASRPVVAPSSMVEAPSLPNPIAAQALPITPTRGGSLTAVAPTADMLVTPASALLPDTQSAPTEAAEPVRSEALSLLQLVRDQITRRPATKERASSVPHRGEGGPVATLDNVANVTASPFAPAPTATPMVAPAIQPLVDIGGTLASSVVDMGVQGQWIDGLARDIAGLSANGAQGRFQINASQLGAVQVDIRQGSDGADISLIAASDAAVTALRQDSDRLRSDAALSSVRIADIRIDRAPAPAEAPRGDTGNQQGGAPSQNGSLSQGMNQGASQGRPQPRENFATPHKAGGEPAVLNHVDAREIAQGGGRTAGHARYA